MIERFLEKNVEKLTVFDIMNFAQKNRIALTEEEAIYILKYLKTNWREALYEPNEVLVKKLYFFDEKTKEKVLALLHFYRNKYKAFL